ncbi:hypothetical protein L0U85_06715 [Glycomyces sp. L485]|uniref:hypothetical protein n=1 Tax=Glycomyces sp. L485 TaxID=2909235 RepID=UPI001F4A7B3B|nr:hypothetical protein [Glycomyces sp. L485]MCH7230546.1 hypothetical protein [Glycomyces sp. L485]
MLQRLVDLIAAREQWAFAGLDLIEPGTTPMDLARGEFLLEFTVVLSLPVVLMVLALVSSIGLQKRKRWARILTAVWSGVLLLPLAGWAAGCLILMWMVPEPAAENYYIGSVDPFTLNAVAGTVAFAGVLLTFILIFTRSVRQWAPKRSAEAGHDSQWGYVQSAQPGPAQQPAYPPVHRGFSR